MQLKHIKEKNYYKTNTLTLYLQDFFNPLLAHSTPIL